MKTRTTVLLGIVGVATFLSLPLAAKPPIYMDFGDIKGAVTEARHRGWIEIDSWSFGAAAGGASSNRVQGNRIGTDAACSGRHLQFRVKGKPPAAMAQQCQARQVVPNLVVVKVGAGGASSEEEHHLQNVTFTSCQIGDGSIPTDQFSINFTSCTHTSAGKGGSIVVMDPTNGATAGKGGSIVVMDPTYGAAASPTPVQVESLVIGAGGTSAALTLNKAGRGTRELLANGNAQSMTVELNNGPKWTFYDVKVAKTATESFALTFSRMDGPASGFQGARR